jgi:hypothetical protein
VPAGYPGEVAAPGPGHSLVTSIEGRALRSEGNGSPAWSGLQTALVERTPEKSASAEASTQHGIEAVHFYAFASSRLTPRSTVCHDFSSDNE